MSQRSEAELVLRALTKQNLKIIALINDRSPGSVAVLSAMANRSQSNVSRSLSVLAKVGIVRLEGGRPKKPMLARSKITLILQDISSK